MEIIISDICRCCMSDSNSHEMKSIFSEINVTDEQTLLSDMLMACTTLNISNEDILPLRLCGSCIDQLTVSYLFKKQCEKTEETLKNILFSDDIQLFTYEDDELGEEVNNKQEVEEEVLPVKKRKRKRRFKEIAKVEADYDVETLDEEIESIDLERCNKLSDTENIPDTKEFFDFKCNYCEKLFFNKISLRSHLKIHTKVHACPLCSKTFRSTHGLWYHVKRHYNIKEFPCTLCEKKFTVKQALEKHFETMHTDVKRHLCPECGKVYSSHDALSYHLKQHKGQRPYLCVHCGKTFKQACHLKNHMWIHTGIKPFKCEVCGNCYTTGYQLKRHQISHNRKTNDEEKIVNDFSNDIKMELD